MMIKNVYVLLLTFISLSSYAQHTTFEPNINPDAKELKQALAKSEDLLLLESETIIRQVDIINDHFFKTIIVDSTKAEIDLNMLPIGNYIIKARLGKKRIVMYVEKHGARDTVITNTTLEIDKEQKVTTNENVVDTHDRSQVQKSNKSALRATALYWVVSESNTSFGSHKSMRLEYPDKVSHLISKNQLEIKSDIAKNNRLLIYEVYNRSQFMTQQLRNQHYYKSQRSETFNVVPIYSSSPTSDMSH